MLSHNTVLAVLAAAATIVAVVAAPAMANDALKGRWVGPVGSVQATLVIQNAQAGTLTGTMKAGNLNYAISGGPPSAANGQGTFQGNAVTIKTPGGTWAMQLQGNQLKGRYMPDSTRGRATDIALSKQ